MCGPNEAWGPYTTPVTHQDWSSGCGIPPLNWTALLRDQEPRGIPESWRSADGALRQLSCTARPVDVRSRCR